MAHYIRLVEHYFRLAVRDPVLKDDVSRRWSATTKGWMNTLSKEDYKFIYNNYSHNRIPVVNYETLLRLTSEFAAATNLI